MDVSFSTNFTITLKKIEVISNHLGQSLKMVVTSFVNFKFEIEWNASEHQRFNLGRLEHWNKNLTVYYAKVSSIF